MQKIQHSYNGHAVFCSTGKFSNRNMFPFKNQQYRRTVKKQTNFQILTQNFTNKKFFPYIQLNDTNTFQNFGHNFYSAIFFCQQARTVAPWKIHSMSNSIKQIVVCSYLGVAYFAIYFHGFLSIKFVTNNIDTLTCIKFFEKSVLMKNNKQSFC